MSYLVNVFNKKNDKELFNGKASQDGVLEILKRFSSLNGFDTATFMHDLRQSGTAHILEENDLPYEIVATTE